MTAKEYLRQYRYIDRSVEAKLERIERLRALAERRTAAYGQSGGGGGRSPDSRMDVVARLVDAQRELDQEIAQLLDTKAGIEAAIARLPDERMRAMLEMRYLQGRKWDDIAAALGYCRDNVLRLHRAALKKVSNQPQVSTQF